MKTLIRRSLLLSAVLALPAVPAAGQRPPLTAQVNPDALAAGRLQVLRMVPGGNTVRGSSTPATPQPQRTAYLTPSAVGEMLARNGMKGSAASEVLRVQPAVTPSIISIQMEAAELVGNRSESFFGSPVTYLPFARFSHTSERSRDAVNVRVQPGGAARYFVDCEVSGMREFTVLSGDAQVRFTNVSNPGTTGHLRFLVERFDENTDAGFRINAGMVGSWAFYGCELTPIS